MKMNRNLSFHDEPNYNGFDIQVELGLVVRDYLDRAYGCFQKAIDQYGRVCMMRFDLHVPEDYAPIALRGNNLIDRFFASLRSKIEWSQARSRKDGNRVHDTEVRFLWCRESSGPDRVHYHVAILLNHDAYAFIGEFNLNSGNMYSRIHEAWASALGIYAPDILGLVHIPDNPVYEIRRDDIESFGSAFYRASYLCKMDTKEYGQGFHVFGCSRI